MISDPANNQSDDLAAAIAVNDGRRLLGWLRLRLDRFEAITADGHSLGLYNNQRAAWAALAAQQQARA